MRMRSLLPGVLVLGIAAGCGDDNAATDAAATVDAPSDAAEDLEPELAAEGGVSECLQVTASRWRLENADDVSISFEATLDMPIEESTFSFLLLFERYGDASYEGVFDLSEPPDDNFGTCPHCAYARSLTNRDLVFYASGGQLNLRTDPFGRALDVSAEGIRLVEVTLDPLTRASTRVPGGRCVDVAPFTVDEIFPEDGWLCERALFGDGNCHCDCGAFDPDCSVDFGDPPAPPVDCLTTEVCGFDPVRRAGLCIERCDRRIANDCGAGRTCIYDLSGEGIDRCTPSEEVISDVALGETCVGPVGLQLYCNIVDGSAQGYCDDTSGNVCRRLCESPSDCEGVEGDCRTFAFSGGLGYCGPEPIDG
ncbi:MAG: hypothetical protein AAF938_27270 [Myxococcota bacterium]